MSNTASPKALKASLMSKSENTEASRKQGLSHLLTYVKRRVEETYISVPCSSSFTTRLDAEESSSTSCSLAGAD